MGRAISISWSDLLAVCLRHANRFSRKVKSITDGSSSSGSSAVVKESKSLFRLVQRKKAKTSDDFGDGGVWQRSILMGDKCQPLAFSGVIYYDCNGKQLNEVPVRSPRASPYPGYAGAGK